MVRTMYCGCAACIDGVGCIPVYESQPVVYSPVVCRCCGGVTVEVQPGAQRMGTDYRHGVGVPWMRVTSYRFWCDDCEVVTWRMTRQI